MHVASSYESDQLASQLVAINNQAISISTRQLSCMLMMAWWWLIVSQPTINNYVSQAMSTIKIKIYFLLLGRWYGGIVFVYMIIIGSTSTYNTWSYLIFSIIIGTYVCIMVYFSWLSENYNLEWAYLRMYICKYRIRTILPSFV